MNSDFESFRRERKYRRQQTKTTERPSGHSDVWEQLEAQERQEMKNELLNAEVDEFFSDATRIAATIVQRVAENHEDEISDKLRQEMEEFLCATIRHATNMVMNLDWKNAQRGGERILEPSLKNLLSKELDQFRAEGTADLNDRHFGQDPFGTGLGTEVADAAPPTAPEPIEEQPGMHLMPADDGPPQPTQQTDPVQSATDSTERVELEDTFGDDELADRRIRLNDDELSVDFCGSTGKKGFEADEFATRVSASSAIQRQPSSPFSVDDQEDMPLAAIAAQESEFADVEEFDEMEFDEPGSEAQPERVEYEEPEVSSEPTTEASAAPEAEPAATGGQSDEEIRRALLLLVDQGIMTPEQARAAYRKQTR